MYLLSLTSYSTDFEYIVAIYKYAAGFVGIVAMFMLVIAAWRWLFAAGNASKINSAKDMVTSVLIGLALLFGGQLLLSQISEDFKSVKPLNVSLPEAYLAELANTDYSLTFCSAAGEDGEKVESCDEYTNEILCMGDTCKVGGKEEDLDFDDRCVPKYNSVGNFTSCVDCQDTCPCTWYANAFLAAEDPCDCDEDRKWIDDECEKAPSGGSYYGGGVGGNIPAE